MGIEEEEVATRHKLRGISRVARFRDDGSVAQQDFATGSLGRGGVVRDPHDRATVTDEAIEQREHGLAAFGIEVAGWLIGQSVADCWQHTRQGDTLLLTSAQFAWLVIESIP